MIHPLFTYDRRSLEGDEAAKVEELIVQIHGVCENLLRTWNADSPHAERQQRLLELWLSRTATAIQSADVNLNESVPSGMNLVDYLTFILERFNDLDPRC